MKRFKFIWDCKQVEDVASEGGRYAPLASLFFPVELTMITPSRRYYAKLTGFDAFSDDRRAEVEDGILREFWRKRGNVWPNTKLQPKAE